MAMLGVIRLNPPVRALASVAAFCAALACSTGPTYQQLGGLPALAPDQGRIVLYMTAETDVPGFRPNMTLDGQDLGLIRTGTFFYVDRAAGSHQVGVRPGEYALGSQGATEPVAIEVEPGGTAYVQVDTISTVGMIQVVLTPQDPADGQRDVSVLHEVPPSAPLPP